jgi:Fe-S cluster assembly protein SufD
MTIALDHAPRIFAFNSDEFPEITGREEEWRFTPIKRTQGFVSGEASFTGDITVTVEQLGQAKFDLVEKSQTRKGYTDKVAALGFEKTNKVATLTIPNNAQTQEPIKLTLNPEGKTVAGQIDINVGQLANATVIIDHTGSGAFAGNFDINVGAGANLVLVSYQDWADDTVQLSHHRITLGKDAQIKHVVITLGGQLVRILPSVNYEAQGGSAELIGLYFAGSGQHAEHRLFVDHSIPNCRSNVVYKGALDGADAHTVWIGDVLIRANALGTDTYEINRNLVLSDGGRADSVPNLEIETGEIVGAGHASTTGRFDDEQLFYLMSRGISEEEARKLVMRGFFEDLLMLINVPEINDRVRAAVELRIAGK